MIALKEITDSSWIIVDKENKEHIGLLSKKPDKSFFMVMQTEKARFSNLSELIEFFEFDIFNNVIERVEEAKKNNFVDGYPVDIDTVIPIYNHESGYPAFKKSETSNIVYCAGYYCVQYPKGWLQAYCPKWSTLQKYSNNGPFHTLIECRAKLSSLKKEEKNEKRTSKTKKASGTIKEE